MTFVFTISSRPVFQSFNFRNEMNEYSLKYLRAGVDNLLVQATSEIMKKSDLGYKQPNSSP